MKRIEPLAVALGVFSALAGCDQGAPGSPRPPSPSKTTYVSPVDVERDMRAKFSETSCYISGEFQNIMTPHWHSRNDCPDLKAECSYRTVPERRPGENSLDYEIRKSRETPTFQQVVPVKVKVGPTGQFDDKGFRYQHEFCSKCCY